MRIKKVKFGNNPYIHFVVGLDLNRIEISLFDKNPKTMVNDLKLKKEYHIIPNEVVLTKKEEDEGIFLKMDDVVIVDLILELHEEYSKLKELEDHIFKTQLEAMGYIEIKYDEKEEDNS